MTGANADQEFSTWAGSDKDAPAHLVPVGPPKQLEVNGAPVIEQSHEYVLKKKPGPDA